MARSPHEDDLVHALPDPGSVARPWLGNYPPGVPPTYRYPDVRVTRFLDDAARDFPGVPATWFDGVTLGYDQLRTQVIRLAAGLRSKGVGIGDRVVISCADLPAVPIVLFAVLRLGAVAVLIRPDDDLDERVADAAPAAVVGDRPALEAAGDETVKVMVRARDWLAPTRRALVTVRRWWSDRGRPGTDLGDLLETGADVPFVEVAADAPAVIVYEGGRPVVHTHASLVAGAFQARLWVPDVQAGKERILLAAPTTGAFGLTTGMLAGVLSAATLMFPRGQDVRAVLDAAGRARPGLCLLRRDLVEELSSDAGGMSSLRAALVDGPVSEEAVRRFVALGGVRLRPVHTADAAGFALASPVYGRSGPKGGMLPVTDTVAVVVDEHDPSHVLPDGEVGRLALHGPQLSPDRTDGQGWLLTSRRASRDADGWLQLGTPRAREHVAGGVA